MLVTVNMLRRPDPKEPTPAQAEAGNYAKRKLTWNGLKITIENEAGSMRRGKSPTGHEWASRMHYAYGYVRGSEGVDGDEVDVFLGPHLDAPTVYVVHQRQAGNWDAYDEDKCMVGFLSEDDARSAYLSCYDDPRFLGDVTAMPLAEFIAKVKATKEAPAMIKSEPALLLLKSYVGPYIRSGRIVGGYANRRTKHAEAAEHQLELFPNTAPKPHTHVATPVAEQEAEPRLMLPDGRRSEPTERYYVTMVKDAGTAHQQVAWLAGPFDTHEEAKSKVGAAKAAAIALDGFHHFNAFGTAKRTANEHPPGRLNAKLGL